MMYSVSPEISIEYLNKCVIMTILAMVQVDLVAQSDSVYDIIDPADHFIMRSNLVHATTLETGSNKHNILSI